MRVLHVEDDLLDQRAVQSALDAAAVPYKLTCTASLAETLPHLQNGDYDVVLLDLNLPDSEGIETFLSVRRQSSRAPIVVVTGDEHASIAREAIEAGAHDYLLKSQIHSEAVAGLLKKALHTSRREQALRRTEHRLHEVLRNAPVVLWSFDSTATITFIEGRGLESLGVGPEDLLGKRAVDVFPNEPDMPRIVDRALSGEAFTDQYKLAGRHFETTVSPHLSSSGEFLGCTGVTLDITDRVLAEQARGKSEQLYVEAVRASKAGLWDWDILRDHLTYSEEIEAELLGDNPILPPPETIEAFLQMIHPDDREIVAQTIQAHFEKATPYTIEFRFPYRDGTYRWLQSRGEAQRDAGGNPIRMVGTLLDISDRKEAEQELARRSQQVTALAELGQTALNAANPLDVMTQAVRLIAQSLDVQFAKVQEYLPETDSLVIRAAYGFPDNVLGLTQPAHEQAQEDSTLRERTQIELQDIASEPGAAKNSLLVRYGVRSALTTIIPGESGRYGVLGAHCTRPRDFTDDDHTFLNSAAHIISSSIMRARAEERVNRQLGQLEAMRTIDAAITSSLDLRMTLNILLDQAITQLGVDAADVLLLNRQSTQLEFAAKKGFRTEALRHTKLRPGEGYAGRAMFERTMITVPDLRAETGSLAASPHLANEGFVSYIAVPLIAKGKVVGVLETFTRTPIGSAGIRTDFLALVAGQAAIAIDNAELFEGYETANLELRLAYDATLEGWSRALDLRDHETEGHSKRVTELTLKLAAAMGMTEEDLVHVRRGALLHDIGKMGIPDSILLKPGPLTDEEWAIMRKHPQYAHDLLQPIRFLRAAIDIPYCHHEKWDGTGYPRGLAGEEIPLAARVFAVIDVWDALLSDRPYRQGWPSDKVLEHIHANSGTHFDPEVVKAFVQLDLSV